MDVLVFINISKVSLDIQGKDIVLIRCMFDSMLVEGNIHTSCY